MARSPDGWTTFVEQIPMRLTPAFVGAGLRPVAPLKAVPGNVPFVDYDTRAGVVLVGLAQPGGYAAAADLLSLQGAELDRLLDLVGERLTLCAVGRHLRVSQGTASNDEWLEVQVANAVAYAASARTFAPHRSFLTDALGRAIQNLQQRRMLALPGDIAGTPEGERLLQQLLWFYGDTQRSDLPDLDATLGALVAPAGTADRKRAESEVVLLQTLTEGPPALRRTAAELFAQEASAEALAKLLAAPRPMPADVRLTLAQALAVRGNGVAAATHLSALATDARTAPAIAAAAALVLETPSDFHLDVSRMLNELEESGLAEALRLVQALPTASGFTVVWPMLSARAPAVRKEAYRLPAGVLPESDAWTGITDPEPSIRAASVARLSERPGLPRALAQLALDEDVAVRQAAMARARTADVLASEVGRILVEKDTDEGRMTGAAVIAHRAPEWSIQVLAGVFARRLRPFLIAASATKVASPANRHLALVDKLASDALQRQRRELMAFVAEAFGRADWLTLLEMSQAHQNSEAEEAYRALAGVLPRGWFDILFESEQAFDPLSALSELALDHPEPLVRAAILLWLLRSGHQSPESIAAMAMRDSSPAVGEVIALTRDELESTMSLTAIEKALFLRTVPLFRSVPTQNLLAIAGAMVPMIHGYGESIVKQGELGDRLFVLYQGKAQAVRTEKGEEKQLAMLDPGAVFGEMSLFDLEPRSASVVAMEQCETLMLDGASFHKLGVQFPEILWEVCRVLSQRLRTTDQVLATRAAA
jgi:hypothetical protein